MPDDAQLAVVGGLAVSQLLTLYTVPVVYLWLDRIRLRVRAGFGSVPTPDTRLKAGA